MLGVSILTLRQWEKLGKLIPSRFSGGVRYYTHQQYLKLIGVSESSVPSDDVCVIYARVSTRNQKDDLKTQIALLREFCNSRGMIVSDIMEDYGGEMTYNRKYWNRLLNDVMDQKVSGIVIAHKDRFVRFGFDWFDRLSEKFGCEIIVVNNDELSPGKELVEDIVTILHVFSYRLYGLQKYKKKTLKIIHSQKKLSANIKVHSFIIAFNVHITYHDDS